MDQAYLKSLLSYDASTGKLTWLVTRGFGGRGAVAGAVAGSIKNGGYVSLKIDGVRYQAHRIIWLLVHGVWPPDDVDHVNGVRDDNRLANLRLATRVQNGANRGLSKNNSTGAIGVTFRRGRYEARIGKNWARKHLGTFHTLEQASKVYAKAAKRLNGEFVRQGGVSSVI